MKKGQTCIASEFQELMAKQWEVGNISQFDNALDVARLVDAFVEYGDAERDEEDGQTGQSYRILTFRDGSTALVSSDGSGVYWTKESTEVKSEEKKLKSFLARKIEIFLDEASRTIGAAKTLLKELEK